MTQSVNPWNTIFAEQGRVFTEPHEAMARIVQLLKTKNAQTILDLGSGTGRHVIYLAQNDFALSGLDSAPEGIAATQQWLATEGLTADLRLQNMTEPLPYPDNFFDAVVSVQVIHHADIATIRAVVAEVSRVLKQDGFLFITVPKFKNQGKNFRQIEPNTYIPLDGPEKGLPHHYFSPEALHSLLADYRVDEIQLDSHAHYCVWAFKQ